MRNLTGGNCLFGLNEQVRWREMARDDMPCFIKCLRSMEYHEIGPSWLAKEKFAQNSESRCSSQVLSVL